jgi:hypothetical protein
VLFLLDWEPNVELGGLERDNSVPVPSALADAVRVGAIPFRLTGAPDGLDVGKDGFLGGPGFAS